MWTSAENREKHLKHFTQENRLSVLWAQTLTVTLGLHSCPRVHAASPYNCQGDQKKPLLEHNEVKTSEAVEPSAAEA